MKPYNILVFPCGSEIALEIHRSLKYSRFINLIGANSINDHGLFIYENYIGGVPFITDETFITCIKDLVHQHEIDAIYPAMDSVITKLKENEEFIGCKVISSNLETTEICLSKKKTYTALQSVIKTPKVYNIKEDLTFPLFAKPDIGYGSRGTKIIKNKTDFNSYFDEYPDSLLLEFLPYEEYTIDCFTNYKGELLYAGARERIRTSNGISVNTAPIQDDKFIDLAKKINNTLNFNGAWFFQMKKNVEGEYVLLEIASRMGGSSSLHRNKGINFALLSIFNAFNQDVSIIENEYNIELDRALDNKYKINFNYSICYVDFDDCLIINNKVNLLLLTFIYQCINKNIKIILLTKHKYDINESLTKYRLRDVFDSVIQIKPEQEKSLYIKEKDAIFIDDSFAERQKVAKNCKIPVFSPDMVEALIN